MPRRVALLLATAATLTACSADGPATAPESSAPQLANAAAGGPRDRYIVVFKDDVRDTEGLIDALTRGNGAQVHYRYGAALKGFAATLPSAAVEGIARNPNVAYVEPDGIVTADATQTPATWGIDRIDQRNLPLNNSFTYASDGSGVTAYIIDTGIRFTHQEFGGRATSGFDAVDGGTADDCNGHGTHVAGTVGGSTYGVAQNVNLVAVRVLDCGGSGTTSGVIAGVDWVRQNAPAAAVANMSLGGGASSALDQAVTNASNAGVVFVVAAGNSNRDACRQSPARAPAAITVGATTSTDARASYSNYGSCLDLFAPGSGITSAWHTSNSATNTISGTSMASPHVAGVAALILESSPSASVATVTNAIVSNATTGAVGNAGRNSPNRLLFTNY